MKPETMLQPMLLSLQKILLKNNDGSGFLVGDKVSVQRYYGNGCYVEKVLIYRHASCCI